MEIFKNMYSSPVVTRWTWWTSDVMHWEETSSLMRLSCQEMHLGFLGFNVIELKERGSTVPAWARLSGA